MVVLGGMCILGFFLLFFYYTKYKKMYHVMEEMLDGIVEERHIVQSDIEEGELSALVSKAIRVQQKLEFEISQATEEKDEMERFISDLSHQLKTPLASVLMFQELLENPELEEKDKEHLQHKLRSQTERLQWILNSLFKMIKLEQNTMEFPLEQGNITETILEAIGLIYEKAEKKEIQLELTETKEIPLFYHKKWMVEVLINILENAIKYTPFGGKIEISIKELQMYSCVQIQDNGIGIEKEEQLKIFQRFYRSQQVENTEGSGIGLYLSKLIMEKQKGYITVESKTEKGSCFFLYLQNCKN